MAFNGLLDRLGGSGKSKFSTERSINEDQPERVYPSFYELIDLFIDTEDWDFDGHVHSSYSDGGSIKEMIETAEKIGVQVGIADHSRKDTGAVILYDTNDNEAYSIAMNGETAELESQLDNLDFSIRDLGSNPSEELEKHVDDFKGYLDAVKEYYRNNLEIGIPEPSENFPEDTVKQISRDSVVKAAGGEELSDLGKSPKEALKSVNMSIEKDYESWVHNGIEQLLEENDLDHAVVSVHNLPEGFVQGNMHDKQTQYIRKANLSHLEDRELREATKRYQAEYMRAILELNDTSDLNEEELNQLENIYSKYSTEDDFETYESENKSVDTPIIHSHWDLIFTNSDTREVVEEDYIDDILDFAEITGATLEANGRIIGKLRQEYTDSDNFYAPEDAEMFARKLASRSEESDLEYVASTDAHSRWEMFRQHLMLQPIVKDYGTPLTSEEFYSRT